MFGFLKKNKPTDKSADLSLKGADACKEAIGEVRRLAAADGLGPWLEKKDVHYTVHHGDRRDPYRGGVIAIKDGEIPVAVFLHSVKDPSEGNVVMAYDPADRDRVGMVMGESAAEGANPIGHAELPRDLAGALHKAMHGLFARDPRAKKAMSYLMMSERDRKDDEEVMAYNDLGKAPNDVYDPANDHEDNVEDEYEPDIEDEHDQPHDLLQTGQAAQRQYDRSQRQRQGQGQGNGIGL